MFKYWLDNRISGDFDNFLYNNKFVTSNSEIHFILELVSVGLRFVSDLFDNDKLILYNFWIDRGVQIIRIYADS